MTGALTSMRNIAALLTVCLLTTVTRASSIAGEAELAELLQGLTPVPASTGCDAKEGCKNSAKDTDTLWAGGYKCTCKAGYVGGDDGYDCHKQCTPEQEEELECPTTQHMCVLGDDGAPKCACMRGLRAYQADDESGEGTTIERCSNINECDECRHSCPTNAECYDLDPAKANKGYHCKCPADKMGETCTENISAAAALAIESTDVATPSVDVDAEPPVKKAKAKVVATTAAPADVVATTAAAAAPVTEAAAKGDTKGAKKRRRKRSVNKLKAMDYSKLDPQYKFDYCKNQGPKAFKKCHKYADRTDDYTKHQGYFCRCRRGYDGDGYFCAKNCNDHSKDTACEEELPFSKCGIDDAGKETCICLAGTRYDAELEKCVDIDECLECTHNCHVKSQCLNGRIGHSVAFECKCPPHHAGVGNDRCYDYNECDPTFKESFGFVGCEAVGNAKCLDFKGFFKCNCKAGFRGVQGAGLVPGPRTDEGKKMGAQGRNDTVCSPSCDKNMEIEHAKPTDIVHTAKDKRTEAPWAAGATTAEVKNCMPGYSIEDPKKIGRCESNSPSEPGKWVNQPKCIPTCKAYSGKPHIVPTYAHPMKVEGSKLAIACEKGFVLQGPKEAVCEAGKWATKDGVVPTCIEPCKPLSMAECNIACTGMDGGFYVQNSVCNIQCKDGGVFECGKKNKDTVKAICLEGKWTYPSGPPKCIKPCAPLTIARSKMTAINRGDDKHDTCGEKMEVECELGYQLDIGNGVDGTKKTVSECLQNGWAHQKNKPQCKPGCKVDAIRVDNALKIDYGTTLPYVDVGHTVQIFCVKEALREGSSQATCAEDGKWQFTDEPKCKQACHANLAVSCGKISYTQQVDTLVRQGGTAHLTCDNDKTLLGTQVITCTEKGWSEKLGECNSYCDRTVLIDNAKITYEKPKGVLLENSTAQINCVTGYEQSYAEQATCRDGKWLYEKLDGKPSQETTCTAYCEKFNVANAKTNYAELINQKVRIQSNARVRCNDGYSMEGEPNLRCIAQGKYDHSPPICVKGCMAVKVAKGNVKYSTPILDKMVLKGTTLSVKCTTYHKLEGTCTLTCLGDGKYDHATPKCLPVCSHFSIEDASIKYSVAAADIPVGAVADVTCEKNHNLKGPGQVKCTAANQWSEKPSCQPVCPTITEITNGTATPSFSGPFVPAGEFVAFACSTGHILYGAKRINCIGPNEYSEPPPVCRPGCAPFKIKNGAVAYSTVDRPITLDGHAKVKCNHGYMLTGPDVFSCVATDSWSTDPKATQCVPACNKDHVAINNGRAVSESDKRGPKSYLMPVGDILTIVCNEGHIPSFDGRQTCVGPNKWDVNVQCLPFIETIHPGSCYAILPANESHTFERASTVCHTYNAHIVSIGSATEHWRVIDHLRERHRPVGWNGVRYWTETYKPTPSQVVNTDKTACPYAHMAPVSHGGAITRRTKRDTAMDVADEAPDAKELPSKADAEKELSAPGKHPALKKMEAALGADAINDTEAEPPAQQQVQFLPSAEDSKGFMASVPDRFKQYQAKKHVGVTGKVMMLDLANAVLTEQPQATLGIVMCERPCHNTDHFSLPGKCVVW